MSPAGVKVAIERCALPSLLTKVPSDSANEAAGRTMLERDVVALSIASMTTRFFTSSSSALPRRVSISFSSTMTVSGLLPKSSSALLVLSIIATPTLLTSDAHRKIPVLGFFLASAAARLAETFRILGLLRLVPEIMSGRFAASNMLAISLAWEGLSSSMASIICSTIETISFGAKRWVSLAMSSSRSVMGERMTSGLFSSCSSSRTAASCH